MHKGKKSAFLILATLAATKLSACGDTPATSVPQKEAKQSQSTPLSPDTAWYPDWDTTPDKNRKIKDELAPTVGLVKDGFRGSPVFQDKAKNRMNAQSRDAFVRSFTNIPECAGLTLSLKEPNEADFALQIFNGISGRTGKYQWILYRTDTMGEAAHGEVTGLETAAGRDQNDVTRSACSSIHNAATPKGGKVIE